MAAAVVTNQGEVQLLAAALSGRIFLRLFRSNGPVVATSILSDFEAALFPGYADHEVTGLFPLPVVDGTGQAFSPLPVQMWTRGAGGVPESEYGWLLYKLPAPDSVLLCGQKFLVPVILDTAGQVITVSIAAFLLRG